MRCHYNKPTFQETRKNFIFDIYILVFFIIQDTFIEKAIANNSFQGL